MASSILPQGIKTPRCAIYARVSTNDKGQDPEMQIRELRQFAEIRGWTIAGEYTDSGICGAKDSRPELNRLTADAAKRRFDVVAVWRFDRFARSTSHLLRALEQFRALGIEFVSFSENVDTSTPTGKMVFTVLGAVAELERSLIAERVRAGASKGGDQDQTRQGWKEGVARICPRVRSYQWGLFESWHIAASRGKPQSPPLMQPSQNGSAV